MEKYELFLFKKKYELISQGTYDFQNLRNKTLAAHDYERVKIPNLLTWV